MTVTLAGNPIEVMDISSRRNSRKLTLVGNDLTDVALNDFGR